MKILVINCGSSSLKYQVLDMNGEVLLAKGLVERIGLEGSVITHEKIGMDKVVTTTPMENHKKAIALVLEAIINKEYGVVNDMSEIQAVGHRVVHAGEKYASSVLITEDVMAALEECVALAPLHNPPNLLGIEACRELMPTTPMVGVFDTAFHQTMKPASYIYAIPYEYYEKYGVRRYGFHGTSHRYVSQKCAEILEEDVKDLKIITCHLGNGASIAAVQNGICVDTSMGFTPLEGLVMGTRSGDLDPTVMTFLMNEKGYSADEMNQILNKKSGVLGVSGLSSDFRDLEEAAEKGNERAQLALDMFITRVRRYVGGFMAELGHVDAISFAGGIGENSASMRKLILENMEEYGIIIDDAKNDTREEAVISADNSRVKVLVVPTNEELMIARDTMNLVK